MIAKLPAQRTGKKLSKNIDAKTTLSVPNKFVSGCVDKSLDEFVDGPGIL